MDITPAMEAIYRDDHPMLVIQKAAQVGISEYLINVALWAAETGQGGRGNALYVMPTQKQIDDFSQARVDKAISESAYLRQRLYPPPPGRAGPARRTLKKLGDGYIYLRGSDSKRHLTSVDADVVILDEFDLMVEGVLERAKQRIASSKLGWLRAAATPTLPEAGINELFLQSDQHYYFLRCEACGHDQRLDWDKNVDKKRAQLVCSKRRCRKPLNLWAEGHWEAAAPSNDRIRGYHINRLYSPFANLQQIIYDSEATTPAALREFKNGVLGEIFVPPGGRLSMNVLDQCRRDYEMPDGWSEKTYMGVDVGTKLHVVIRARLDEEKVEFRSRTLFIGEIDTFEELEEIALRYNVQYAVVDAQPEQRAAVAFAKDAARDVGLAYYRGDEPGWDKTRKNGVYYITAARTPAIEAMFHAFQVGRAELPADARQLGGRVRDGQGEYYREMLTLIRYLEQNAQGNWVGRYDDQGKADHFAHAEVYCMLAAEIKASRRSITAY